jgi:beta-xylosidase
MSSVKPHVRTDGVLGRPHEVLKPLYKSLPMPTPPASLDYPWIANQRDGTFRNPILSADYPDPDVIRDGDDFYMVASSFHCTPGLPILHSRNLVDWTIVQHAVQKLPHPRFGAVQPGCGVWAPSIRKHDGRFWIFFPMPDEGIYCVSSAHPAGDWSAPYQVQEGAGLIDPCPFWDDDGSAYLVHAYAGSRAGIKHKLRVRPMAADCSRLLGEGQIVFEDPLNHPTIEGPKFLKRNGYYYILAPAGGVTNGWQLALRSRHIYGPYEAKVILEQGSTAVNGPHQGALFDTPAGEWWFIHYQDMQPCGRIVHLQPARWENGWPLIGVDHDGNGIGEPVAHNRNPIMLAEMRIGSSSVRAGMGGTTIAESWSSAAQISDEFDAPQLGSWVLCLQWHWNANYLPSWYSLSARPGWLRLFIQPYNGSIARHSRDGENQINLVHVPNVLMQKFPAHTFMAETCVDFRPSGANEYAGLAILGRQYAALAVRAIGSNGDGHGNLELVCLINGAVATAVRIPRMPTILRISVNQGVCSFSCQTDEAPPLHLPVQFRAIEGFWVGAKIGLFAIHVGPHLDTTLASRGRSNYADFDYLRFHPVALDAK